MDTSILETITQGFSWDLKTPDIPPIIYGNNIPEDVLNTVIEKEELNLWLCLTCFPYFMSIHAKEITLRMLLKEMKNDLNRPLTQLELKHVKDHLTEDGCNLFFPDGIEITGQLYYRNSVCKGFWKSKWETITKMGFRIPKGYYVMVLADC
jgi:hypothetical protein